MKRLKALLTAIIFSLVIPASLSGCSDETSSQASSQEDTQSASVQTVSHETSQEYFDEKDLLTDYNNVTASIKLSDSGAEIDGTGAEYTDGVISLTSGGTFVFSGEISDGRIYINNEEETHVIFNGVNISCSSYSPFFVENSDKVILTVADGTQNSLSDGESYIYENQEENEPDAVIFSKDDLSINGGGSLEIKANYNEGITCKDDLRIAQCSLDITSVGNAIKGKDSVAVLSANIKIDSEEDGIKSSNSEETDKGYIVFESVTFDITSLQDAVQAESSLIINGGEYTIKSGSREELSDTMNQTADGFGRSFMDMDDNQNEATESKKGLKSAGSIVINDGVINADCEDDSVHSNGNIQINGGELSLSSGDDGIHADETVDITGGNITVVTSYEGIEGKVINVDDGVIDVMASDDGFNASDGNGGSMDPGAFGSVSSECELNINGGSIYVNAGGDGLDSNGIINVNGGTSIVDGSVNDGNGALDSGSEIVVNGGILVAAGSSGMAEIPSENSGQCSIAVSFAQTLTSSESVCIKDSDGNVILSYQPAKEYSSVIISTPDLTESNEYSVYYGGDGNTGENHGLSLGDSYTGGELLDTVTLESKVTSAGTGTLGQMGGGMQFGGGFGQGDNGGNMQPFQPGDDKGMTIPENGGMGEGGNGNMPNNGEAPGNAMEPLAENSGI